MPLIELARHANPSVRPLLAASAALVVLLAACGGDSGGGSGGEDKARISRTSFGIVHVAAQNYRSLAFGAGYAFAQDNVCTFAEKINQINAERSKYFGADSLAPLGASSTGSISSLNSDFLYKLQYDKATIAALWAKATPETHDMARGYADGFNRYLVDTGVANLPAACRGAAWVRAITPEDLYLWWSSIVTISGSQAFGQMIADGGYQPPGAVVGAAQARAEATRLASAKPMSTERMLASAAQAMAREAAQSDAGSNGWAFGSQTTENGRGMLLTNPHWPWGGMAKFWQVHLTIPGEIDVMGAAYPGTPIVLFGFNENVGWTHTVSTGPRYTIRELKLGATPTSYVVDGVEKPMTARTLTVEVLGGPAQTRTYYTTEFGPLLKNTGLGLDWTAARAFAFDDINMLNNRLVEQWLALGKSRSAEQARQALGTILGAPLINTLIADSSGDAVYTDYSLKPYLSDAKLATCVLPGVGQTLTAAGRPTLDASRSSCNPDTDASTRQPGVLPMNLLPFLRRGDYVANANNSYYYTNPAQPITGLPSINGPQAVDIGLRPRMNLTLIAERLAGTDGLGGNKLTPAAMQAMLIGSNQVPLAGNRSKAAELLMDAVLSLCSGSTAVTMADGSAQDIGAACGALAGWDRRYNPQSVGTHVFREFFNGANAIGASLWATPFSAADPVNTPRDPNLASAAVNLKLRQALGQSLRNLAAKGIALDKPWGELFYTVARGKNLPTGGGSSAEGVANQMNGAALSATGYNDVSSGSSYVATMAFGPNGPEVDAVLIPGQSTDPASPYYYDQLESLWSQRQWHRLPFKPSEIAADPNLTVLSLTPQP